MHILFISSGNQENGISSLIKNQGDSLASLGHKVSYFTILGKGLKGYISNIFIFRNYLKNKSFDIIHAHYSLSAMVASFASSKHLVVSLMGSDVKATKILKYIIKLFAFFSWKTIIIKSSDMKDSLSLSKVYIIPNGVNLNRFKPIDRTESLKITKWNSDKKHILFGSNPARKEKNYQLTKEAFDLLNDKNVELHSLINIPNELIPYYLNAADVVILTSLWEGSPNIVKEAMACNSVVMATQVGDVRELTDNVSGCFVVSYEPDNVVSKLKLALAAGRSNGRERIIELGLDSESVAKKITALYSKTF